MPPGTALEPVTVSRHDDPSADLPESDDVVVVGAGGAGMTAALAAQAAGPRHGAGREERVLRRVDRPPGGGVWIPGNYALKAAGQVDDPRASREALPGLDRRRRGPEGPPRHLHRPRARGHGLRRATDAGAVRVGPALRRLPPRGARRPRRGPHRRSRCRWTPGSSATSSSRLHPPYTKAPANLIVTQADYRRISLGLRTIRGPADDGQGRWCKRIVSLVRGQQDVRDGQRDRDRAAQGPAWTPACRSTTTPSSPTC